MNFFQNLCESELVHSSERIKVREGSFHLNTWRLLEGLSWRFGWYLWVGVIFGAGIGFLGHFFGVCASLDI